MRYSNCLNRGNASYCWCPCNCLIWLEIRTAKGLWSLVLTRVTQTCLGQELWHLSYSKGMWVPRQFFFRTYGENSQEGKDPFRIGFVSHHRKGRFNLMLRIDHQSYNSTSNCYTFLNKRFVSVELYKMLGVELLTLVPFGSHVYIFSLQPWPQSRQVWWDHGMGYCCAWPVSVACDFCVWWGNWLWWFLFWMWLWTLSLSGKEAIWDFSATCWNSRLRRLIVGGKICWTISKLSSLGTSHPHSHLLPQTSREMSRGSRHPVVHISYWLWSLLFSIYRIEAVLQVVSFFCRAVVF